MPVNVPTGQCTVLTTACQHLNWETKEFLFQWNSAYPKYLVNATSPHVPLFIPFSQPHPMPEFLGQYHMQFLPKLYLSIIYLSIYLSIYHLSIYHLPTYLSIYHHLSIYLSSIIIYLSIYLFMVLMIKTKIIRPFKMWEIHLFLFSDNMIVIYLYKVFLVL